MPGMSTNDDTTTPEAAAAIAARTVEFFDGNVADALFAARRAGMSVAVIAALGGMRPDGARS